MALSVNQTLALKAILKPNMRIASLGYPDLIAPVEGMLTTEQIANLQYRADSAAICQRHGLQQRDIPDAVSFFTLLGCELDVYDIVQERGCEILCDLNYPFASKCVPYDIVLDVGTAEHCFNIGQALFNMAGLVKEGGYIIHENPFNCGNHGFYSLNPTLFADFYAANGFELEQCFLTSRNGDKADAPRTQRFKWEGPELNVFALARRVAIQPFGTFTYPTQTKYAKAVPAAGVDRATKEN